MKAIEDQNLKLKAIAWTQSHIVRAPLAKMIGYIDLIENYDISRLDINVLLNHIKDSGVELDSIIKDIVNKTEIVKRDLMDE
jgi:light-regulated signal transduction histidine kinase (bacteriophytochrome)